MDHNILLCILTSIPKQVLRDDMVILFFQLIALFHITEDHANGRKPDLTAKNILFVSKAPIIIINKSNIIILKG
jgi:hypothetical protein